MWSRLPVVLPMDEHIPVNNLIYSKPFPFQHSAPMQTCVLSLPNSTVVSLATFPALNFPWHTSTWHARFAPSMCFFGWHTRTNLGLLLVSSNQNEVVHGFKRKNTKMKLPLINFILFAGIFSPREKCVEQHHFFIKVTESETFKNTHTCWLPFILWFRSLYYFLWLEPLSVLKNLRMLLNHPHQNYKNDPKKCRCRVKIPSRYRKFAFVLLFREGHLMNTEKNSRTSTFLWYLNASQTNDSVF